MDVETPTSSSDESFESSEMSSTDISCDATIWSTSDEKNEEYEVFVARDSITVDGIKFNRKKIERMIDKWLVNPAEAKQLPYAKDKLWLGDDQSKWPLYIDDEYYSGIWITEEEFGLKYGIFTRRDDEKWAIIAHMNKESKEFIKSRKKTIELYQNYNKTLCHDTAAIIFDLVFVNKYKINFNLDLADYFGFDDKLQSACLPCAMYHKNPMIPIYQLTNEYIQQHNLSEDHLNALCRTTTDSDEDEDE